MKNGKMRLLISVVWILLFTSACQALLPASKFDVAFSTPEKEPVYIEEVVYDDKWIGRGGILTCCWKESRALNIIAPRPVPKKIFIRWFNYKQQKFYEANVPLPENTKEQLRNLPKPEFGNHKITTGVLPDGVVVVWVSNGRSEFSGTWIEVTRVQGHEAEGDPWTRKNTTEEMRELGEI